MWFLILFSLSSNIFFTSYVLTSRNPNAFCSFVTPLKWHDGIHNFHRAPGLFWKLLRIQIEHVIVIIALILATLSEQKNMLLDKRSHVDQDSPAKFSLCMVFISSSSNPALNQACSSFLHSMCLNLHSSSTKMVDFSQEGKFDGVLVVFSGSTIFSLEFKK